ncbi:MAG: FAD-dependent monooxygenase [Candidatus Pelagibacterales bacterium]
MINTNITIVGLGITSKLAALTLAANNRKVMIIGDENSKNQFSNLVTFFSLSSINFLKELNLEDVIKQSSSINEISCGKLENLIKDHKFQIHFKDKNNELGRVISNKILNEKLDVKINENKNINISRNINIQNCQFSKEKNILIPESGEKIKTKLLIITEKKTNLLDQNFKNNLIKKDLKQTSLVLDVKSKTKNHAYQIFTEKGAIAYLPINENLASVIWSLDNSSDELDYSQEDILREINKFYKEIIYCDEVLNMQKYKLQFEYAKKTFLQSIVLIGDAAHSIHPIAGQGLNLSIKDIVELKNQIDKFNYLGYPLGNSLSLSEYANLRFSDTTLYSFSTIYLDEIFKSRNYLLNKVSNFGIQSIEKNKIIKDLIIQSATGQSN